VSASVGRERIMAEKGHCNIERMAWFSEWQRPPGGAVELSMIEGTAARRHGES